MLGLKQFSAPQFYVPQIPQTERFVHKAKDFMSFLNSLQWKADEEKADEEKADEEKADEEKADEEKADEWGDTTRDVKFDVNGGLDDRRGAEAAILGLNASLNSGHDVTQPIGSTRWDGMDDSQLWEQAMNSIVTGENPITKGYSEKVGMTPNDVDYNIFNEEEANKMTPEKKWTGYDPYHRLEAIRASVPGIDPSLMTRVGF